jgi:phage terminase large subunit GpA-like protein
MTVSYLDSFKEGLKPEQPLTVSAWADRYRMLSSRASSEPGPWRTSRTPYLKEPMDCLSTSSSVQKVVLMFCSQVGKTEAGSNWLGYVIHHAPGPLLAVQPTVEMAKRLSKQRLESMLQETPVLSDRIAPARSRDSGNTLFSKAFPGGMMLLTGANSATGLRSTPCRYIFCDEVDAFPSDVDGEGDPVALAEKRATTFARRKILLTSTPTVKDFSRIENEFERSDQRRYYIPCPCCGEYQYLKWPQLKWEKSDPSTATYECEKCHERFSEMHKTSFLRKGEWRPTAPGDGKVAGFHLSGLYSPLGWFSWQEMVEEWLRCKNDAPALKTFVNTRLSETWAEDYVSAVSTEGLLERVESYKPGTVPQKVILLTMGVDVQGGGGTKDQRLSVSVWGWAEGEEGWLIDHQTLMGDAHQADVWTALDLLVNADWVREDGVKMKISITAIDSGGLATMPVYQYCRTRLNLGVVAIKGASTRGQPPISRGKRIDINTKGKSLMGSVILYMVGSDTCKDALMGRVRHNKLNKEGPSPGYLHFHSETDESYFRELTAERQILKSNRSGFTVPTWVKKAGVPCERLDELVYAYAGLNLLYQRYPRSKIWLYHAKKLLNEPKKPSENKLNSKSNRSGRDYVNNW